MKEDLCVSDKFLVSVSSLKWISFFRFGPEKGLRFRLSHPQIGSGFKPPGGTHLSKIFGTTLPSPAGQDDQYILLSSNVDFVFIFRNVYVHEYYTEINCFVTCVQKRSSFLPVAIKFRLVKLQSRIASASIMNFFPSCCRQANIILLVTSVISPSDYVLFPPSHVCRQLAILVADFFSSQVLYFARAESSISTKWSANCKETKGL